MTEKSDGDTPDTIEPPKNIQQGTLTPPSRSRVVTLLLPLQFLKRPVKLFWVALLGAIALMQFAYNYRPRLTIEAIVALDESDPLNTLFRVTNTGPWHLDDLHFFCYISIPGISPIEEGDNTVRSAPGAAATGQPPIARLDPGHSETRDCSAGIGSNIIHIPPYDPTTLRLDITTRFRWPYVGLPDSAIRHFTVRRYADGRRFSWFLMSNNFPQMGADLVNVAGWSHLRPNTE
jgi:hypothetical protein